MKIRGSSGRDRYVKFEILFFIIYFLVFPVLTAMEAGLNEKRGGGRFDWIGWLISGIMYGLPAWFCYRWIIKGLLLSKKYLLFVFSYLGWLLLLNFYIVYLVYLPLSLLSFLPVGMRAEYSRYFHSGAIIHFSIIYMLRDLLVLSAVAYFFRSEKQEKQISLLEAERLQAELKYLAAQIQPHFFFNTLNNIYSLALEQSPATAPLVAKLSRMMRYILYEASKVRVPIRSELDFLKNYVDIQAVRYSEKVSLRFHVQGIREDSLIEPLLLLPFIENAFKHGLQEETGSGFLNVILCQADEELTLQVSNSLPLSSSGIPGKLPGSGYYDSHSAGKFPAPHGGVSGFPEEVSGFPEEVSGGVGIGIENVRKRLALLYPQKHELSIRKGALEYEVVLTINLHH